MKDEEVRGTFMGYHLVLGALIETHPSLSEFRSTLDRNMQIMLKTSEQKPDSMLHSAEHAAQMFVDHADRLLRDRAG